MLRSRSYVLMLASAAVIAGSMLACGSSTVIPPADAGADGGADAGPDGGADAGADGGADAGPDGGADAGPDGGADAGADAGSNDGGGSGGGGTSDGGSGGGGGTDGGSGGAGGGAPPECAGLMPETAGTMRTISVSTNFRGGCFPASGMSADGAGFLALRNDTTNALHWELFSPAPARTGSIGTGRPGGNLWGQPSGFIAWQKSSFNQAVVTHVDSTGNTSGGREPVGFDREPWLWPDPQGGLVVAGNLIKPGKPPVAPQIWRFDANGNSRGDPHPLGSSGAIFGLGVDLRGRALVVYDGGSGEIDAQWFAPDGAPLTGVFRILSGFVPGPATWFETAPLLGGGLALRRMDASPGSSFWHSNWLLTLSSGAANAQTAPDWLTSRPDTSLQPARNFRAYAILPMGAQGTACSQRLELLAPTGASCGTFDFPIAAGDCDTMDLRLGADGTVLQKLPCEFESRVGDAGSRTNTVRFWPAALR